jgi:integrase
MMRTDEMGDYMLAEVWPSWWEQKQQQISAKTQRCYREYSRPLLAFFGAMKLEDIHLEDIVSYRTSRVTAGPGLINHEVNCLSQILASAGLWAPIAKFYKPLRIPNRGPGQALVQEEALWLLEVASYKKKWKVAYLGSMLSVNTTCGPGELRNLRIKDVNKDRMPPTIDVVEGAKNEYRVRSVPLNADAFWAIQELLLLAAEKGAYLPDHYLFPARPKRLVRDPNEKNSTNKSHPDPTTPVGGWKTAWYALRKEAAKKYPKLATVRMYDLRHHAITSLLENPTISEQTIKDVAGHVSKKILERYSHIRMERKEAALEALDGLRKAPTDLRTATSEGDKPAPLSSTLEFSFRPITTPITIKRRRVHDHEQSH